MEKGRWLGVGCAALFALPFCAAGVGVMFSAPNASGRDLAVRIAAGSVFLIAGLGVIFVAIAATRTSAAALRLRALRPGEPWMWRADWAANAINDQGAVWIGVLWLFAIIWNLISFPLLFAVPWQEVHKTPALAFVFLFPIVGAALFATVVYKSAQRAKYGASVCHLDRVPIVPGHTFHGEIETRVRAMPEKGFTLRLTCMRRTGTGRNSHESVLWDETQTVSFATPGFEGTRVPFSFTVPADAEPTNDTMAARIYWRLSAAAEVPGIDYAAAFDVPVFVTGEKSAAEPVWPAPAADVMSWTPDPRSRVRFSPTPSGGEEFHVGPATTGRIGITLFMIIWWGIIVLVTRLGAPIILTIVFGAFGVLLLVMGIDWVAGRSTVVADRQQLAIRRTWFGVGGVRTIQPQSVDEITTAIGGSVNGVPLYDVIVRCGTAKVNAAKYIRLKRDAEMMAARLKRDIGKT